MILRKILRSVINKSFIDVIKDVLTLIKIRNRREPKLEPWGSPEVTTKLSDLTPKILTKKKG